jgi:hypothetical protein
MESGGYVRKGRCGVAGGVLDRMASWEVFAITLIRYDWIREVAHTYVKTMLLPPRTVPLVPGQRLENTRAL